jgi:hypothetical protein
MQEEIKRILDKVGETSDFEGIDFVDVNTCSSDCDNALHVVGHGTIFPRLEDGSA